MSRPSKFSPSLGSEVEKMRITLLPLISLLIIIILLLQGEEVGGEELLVTEEPGPVVSQPPPRGRVRSKSGSSSGGGTLRKKKVTRVNKASLDNSASTSTPQTSPTVVTPPTPVEDGEIYSSTTDTDQELITTTVASTSSSNNGGGRRTTPTTPSRRSNNNNRGNNNRPRPGGAIRPAGGLCEDECDREECPNLSEESCPNGLVLDNCNCCYVCGALEGNRCYNGSLNLPYGPDAGICGAHLICKLRTDLDPTEPREALCECRNKGIVCGSDNVTYMSECKLREATKGRSNKGLLTVGKWKPCEAAPILTTPVENATVILGEDVSLSCEIRAYPAPIIHWEFLPDSKTGNVQESSSPEILPGDDSGVVIVVRGGPEEIMTTSWIQIISITPKRQGTYFCVATNAVGLIKGEAEIKVYRNPDSSGEE